MIARTFSLVFCALLSVSCGYHLQGTGTDQGKRFAGELKRISVEGLGYYEPFRRDLVSALRSYGFRVVKPAQASARFITVDKNERSIAAAIGDNVKVREYILLLKIRFTVKTAAPAKTLLREQSIQVEVPYLNDPDNLLANQKLQSAARRYGEEQLIRKIIDRLASPL